MCNITTPVCVQELLEGTVSWGTGQCHGCPGMEAWSHLEALSYFMYKMWILELEWALKTFFSFKGKEAKIPRGKWHSQGPRALEQWWFWDRKTCPLWVILEINSLRYRHHHPAPLSPLVNGFGAITYLPQRQRGPQHSTDLETFKAYSCPVDAQRVWFLCMLLLAISQWDVCHVWQCWILFHPLFMPCLHANTIAESSRYEYIHRRAFLSFPTVLVFSLMRASYFYKRYTINHLFSHAEHFLVWTDSSLCWLVYLL